MVKHYKFKKDYTIDEKTYYNEGVELKVREIHGINHVCDGCFAIFRLNSDTAKEFGDIVDRLF